jgi:hypothetical protein
MASDSQRNLCAASRAAGEVSQRSSPGGVTMRPSSDSAILATTQGRRRTIHQLKSRLRFAASAASRPCETATPPARSSRRAAPAWAGLGSVAAKTTRPIFSRRMSPVQGGVRPWVEQGSSVT